MSPVFHPNPSKRIREAELYECQNLKNIYSLILKVFVDGNFECKYYTMAVFILETHYASGRIIRLLYYSSSIKTGRIIGRTISIYYIVRLVMRPQYKDGHKTHYASRRTIIGCASLKTKN